MDLIPRLEPHLPDLTSFSDVGQFLWEMKAWHGVLPVSSGSFALLTVAAAPPPTGGEHFGHTKCPQEQ